MRQQCCLGFISLILSSPWRGFLFNCTDIQVCEIAFTLGNQGVKDTHCVEGIMAYSDSGLPGMLFSLLDQEEDEVIMWFTFSHQRSPPSSSL